MPTTATLRPRWSLDPEVRFLNHGSFGACPRAVQDHQANWRTLMERAPIAFMIRELPAHLDAAREQLASFLRCAPGGLVFVHNATTAVNAVLRSLRLEPGDELLITDHGYNACNNVARFVCTQAGATLRVVDLPFPLDDPAQVVDAVLEAVGPRTKLALLDHITSPTGLVLPLEELVPALRERGVETLVDGAHGAGQLDLDLGRLGAAFYTSNCHKWLCSPKGSAFLHVREPLPELCLDPTGLPLPTVISHGANLHRPTHTRLQDSFDWPGTFDPSAWLSVPFAIETMAAMVPGGWAEIRRHNRALTLAARDLLCETLGIAAPAPDAMIGHLAALPLPARDPKTDSPPGAFDLDPLGLHLFEAHHIEVPVFTWTPGASANESGDPAGQGPQTQRLLRISAQLYNDIGDYRALAAALTSEGLAR